MEKGMPQWRSHSSISLCFDVFAVTRQKSQPKSGCLSKKRGGTPPALWLLLRFVGDDSPHLHMTIGYRDLTQTVFEHPDDTQHGKTQCHQTP